MLWSIAHHIHYSTCINHYNRLNSKVIDKKAAPVQIQLEIYAAYDSEVDINSDIDTNTTIEVIAAETLYLTWVLMKDWNSNIIHLTMYVDVFSY